MGVPVVIDYYQQTGLALENVGYNGETTIPKAPKREKEGEFTDLPKKVEETGEKPVGSIQEDYLEKGITPIRGYSEGYVEFNTQSLINSLDKELQSWETLGTEEALPHISNIKELLAKNSQYLVHKSENRVLFSLLELVFQNNNWDSIDQGDIKYLRQELTRFNNGMVEWKNLQRFSKQLYRKKFSVLKPDEVNEKEKIRE